MRCQKTTEKTLKKVSVKTSVKTLRKFSNISWAKFESVCAANTVKKRETTAVTADSDHLTQYKQDLIQYWINIAAQRAYNAQCSINSTVNTHIKSIRSHKTARSDSKFCLYTHHLL